MKLVFILLAMVISSTSLASEDVETTTHHGWYCQAKSPDSDSRVLKSGPTLEAAKNASRSACNSQFGNCQVTNCYEKSPYKYTCVAGMPAEHIIGAFRTFSDSMSAARSVSMNRCKARHGNKCVSICYPNFNPSMHGILE